MSEKTSSTASATGFRDGAIWGSWTRYPPTLPPEYYAAIGEVCARWSWLEFQLGVIARETLEIEKPAGFSVMSGMSMRTISAVLKALSVGNFPKGHPDLSKAIGDLGEKMNSIGDMRNQYAHALWGHENEQNTRLGIIRFKTPEEKIEPRWTDKPLSAIQADAKELAALQERAQRLTRELKKALHGK